MLILLDSLIGAIFLLIAIGVYAGYRLIHPKKHPPDYTFIHEMNKGYVPKEFFLYTKENFTLISKYGYEISGFYFPGKGEKTVIFSHGISWTKYGCAKYLEYFLQDGWNVFLYDHRASGDSGGNYPSFGFFEKYDMQSVVQFAKRKYPHSHLLGIFGESLGGAVALQYAKMDSSLDFLIAICPFTSLSELLDHHLNLVKIPKIVRPLVVVVASSFIRLNANFWLRDIEPGKDILQSKVPLFLVHGKKDRLVPFGMNERVYNNRKDIAYTQFMAIENAGHTPFLYLDNRKKLESEMIQFLKEIEKNKI
jgi:fermentation-respiration switch protein FrsA (DUF1100 family)